MISKIVLLCVASVVVSRAYVVPSSANAVYEPVQETRPEPYSFGFDTRDEYGTHLNRKEEGDELGNKRGSYGFVDAYGIYRQVDYVADDNGFRAVVRTNEPGTESQNPANAEIISESSPVRQNAPAAYPQAPVAPAYARPAAVDAPRPTVAVAPAASLASTTPSAALHYPAIPVANSYAAPAVYAQAPAPYTPAPAVYGSSPAVYGPSSAAYGSSSAAYGPSPAAYGPSSAAYAPVPSIYAAGPAVYGSEAGVYGPAPSYESLAHQSYAGPSYEQLAERANQTNEPQNNQE